MTLEDSRQVFSALVDEGVDFVVIGAIAMAAQGLPRATQDLDIFVAPDRANVEALKRALRLLFDDPAVDEIDPDELADEYPAIEYMPPDGHFWIDILTRLGEAYSWQDIAANAENFAIGDVIVRVATPRLLYDMKKDTVRPQDHADAARIREAFEFED